MNDVSSWVAPGSFKQTPNAVRDCIALYERRCPFFKLEFPSDSFHCLFARLRSVVDSGNFLSFFELHNLLSIWLLFNALLIDFSCRI